MQAKSSSRGLSRQNAVQVLPTIPAGLHPPGDSVDSESIEEQLIAYSIFKLLRYGSIITALAMLLGVLAVPAIASACRGQASLAAIVWVWAVSAVGALGYFWLRLAAAEANGSSLRDCRGQTGVYRPLRSDALMGGVSCGDFLETLPCDDRNGARKAPIGQEHRPLCHPAAAAVQGRCCGEPSMEAGQEGVGFSPANVLVQHMVVSREDEGRHGRGEMPMVMSSLMLEMGDPAPVTLRTAMPEVRYPLKCDSGGTEPWEQATAVERAAQERRYRTPDPHAREGRELGRHRAAVSSSASSSSAAPPDPGEDRLIEPELGEGLPVCPPRSSAAPLPSRLLRNPEVEELVEVQPVWSEFDAERPRPAQTPQAGSPKGPRMGSPGPALAPRGEDRGSPSRRSPEAFFERFDDARVFDTESTEPTEQREKAFLLKEKREQPDPASDMEEETAFVTFNSKLPFVGAYAVLTFFVIVFFGVAAFEVFSILRPLPDRMPLTTATSRRSPQRWPPLYMNGSENALPYWQAGPWSHCSSGCGVGVRHREVRCAFGSPEECTARQGEAPDSTRECREYLGCQWRAGEWGNCSATCGRGVQRREVLCTNSQIADCFKDLWTVPNETKECQEVSGCRWETHAWGKCSTTCGVGERRRATSCANGHDRFCKERGARPEQAEACESYELCRWNASRWSACSERCGHGTRTRDVACPSGNASQCHHDDGNPPSAEEPCHDVSGCRWATTAWSNCSGRCGPGTQTRNVSCVGGSEEDCEASSDRPAPERSCKDTEACRWAGDWSACSSTCGSGLRTRNVACSLDGKRPLLDVCRGASGEETAAFAESCLNVSGCRWRVGEWTACSSQCGSGEQQRTVTCNGGRPPKDCARTEAPPSTRRPCNRTSGCSPSSGSVALQKTPEEACAGASKNPALMAAGALNALVGWTVSFAGVHELQLHGACSMRSKWASLLALNSILLAGLGAFAIAALLGRWLLPGCGDAQKAALVGSSLATGLWCLGLWVASSCCVAFQSGAHVLLSAPRQVRWVASSLALLGFCSVVLVVAALLFFGQAGSAGR